MQESVAGFKERGTWTDVVEFGERVVRALREEGVESKALEEFDEWRPKAHERLEREVSEKTAEQASVATGKGEEKGKAPEDDLQTAGERLSESYEKLEEDDTGGAMEKWQDSIDYVARAADTIGRKALRKVESTIYENVMTQVAPYYFDNELVSANLQYVRSQGEFEFEVNVNDDDLKDAVRERLYEYEKGVNRWHVDTEKETGTAEAVEGVEPPESRDDAKSTTN